MSATPSKNLLFPAAAAIVAIGAGGWYALQWTGHSDDSLQVSGNIEAIEVPIKFKIPGHVEKRFVDEGDSVKAGQPIAQLEAADVQAEVAQRRGEFNAAQAALAAMVAGSRPDEIAASESIYKATKADLERLKSDLTRAETLWKSHSGAISAEQYDQAVAACNMGTERCAEALKRYQLVKEGPRKEDIDQARAKAEQAKAALQAAEVKLSYATVTSPLTGVVLSKNVEPGEFVASGTPVVTVADIKKIWLRAYVDERDIGKSTIHLDCEAQITTDAYPGKVYKGRVGFISSEQEFTPKTVQTTRERVKFVYRVKIYVDNPDEELKPGMPADAKLIRSDK